MHRVVSDRSISARAWRVSRARAHAACLGYELQIEDMGDGLERVVLVDPAAGRQWAFDHLRQLERFLRSVEYWITKLADIGVSGRQVGAQHGV